ncbi:hypothetical protein NQ318_021046 [Aromia moschata]|uniref:Uncharacterized protein n=1 Tax=Aromia moschata TaxID=1265417 RepID=A0AAV8YAD3_9CUCU|nr:hypothetical protein NQ318_021046 [Aromia moschata]
MTKKTRTKETELVRYLDQICPPPGGAINSNVLESRDEQWSAVHMQSLVPSDHAAVSNLPYVKLDHAKVLNDLTTSNDTLHNSATYTTVTTHVTTMAQMVVLTQVVQQIVPSVGRLSPTPTALSHIDKTMKPSGDQTEEERPTR